MRALKPACPSELASNDAGFALLSNVKKTLENDRNFQHPSKFSNICLWLQ
jgi:hypothetical protein